MEKDNIIKKLCSLYGAGYSGPIKYTEYWQNGEGTCNNTGYVQEIEYNLTFGLIVIIRQRYGDLKRVAGLGEMRIRDVQLPELKGAAK